MGLIPGLIANAPNVKPIEECSLPLPLLDAPER